MSRTSYRARLVPAGKAETYVIEHKTFKKKGGWYQIDDADLATKLAGVRESQINPEASPFVFQVLRVDAAKQLEAAEAVKADPKGTVDEPTVFGQSKAAPGVILTSVPADDPVIEDRTTGDPTVDHLLGNEPEDDEIDEDPEDAEEEKPAYENLEPAPKSAPKRAGRKKVGKKKAAKKG